MVDAPIYINKVSYQPPPRDVKPTPLDINADPGTMFQLFREEGNIIHENPFGEKNDVKWRISYPARQYVKDGGYHVMITPEADQFLNLEHLSEQDLEAPAEYMLAELTSGKNVVAGFNRGQDRTRPTSQTWHNLHVHVYTKPTDLQIATPLILIENTDHVGVNQEFVEARRKIREPYSHVIGNFLPGWLFDQIPELSEVASYTNHPHTAEGSLTLQLSPDISPVQLATLMKKLDSSYSKLHREIFSMFVSNYDEAVTSRGEIPYQCNNHEDIQIALEYFYPQVQTQEMKNLRKFLGRFAHYLRTNPQSKDGKVTVPPAYSITLFNETPEGTVGQDIYLNFMPHFFRAAGTAEALRMYMKREPMLADGPDPRRAAAQEAAEQTLLRLRKDLPLVA